MTEPLGFLNVGLTLDQKMSQMVREIWKDGYEHGEATGLSHVAVMKIVHRLGQLEAHHLKPTSELGPTDIANIELVDPTQHREGRQP